MQEKDMITSNRTGMIIIHQRGFVTDMKSRKREQHTRRAHTRGYLVFLLIMKMRPDPTWINWKGPDTSGRGGWGAHLSIGEGMRHLPERIMVDVEIDVTSE